MLKFLTDLAVIGSADGPTSVMVTGEAPAFTFDPMAFVENLKYMGTGMLVIFVEIGLIALTTMLINWLFAEKK